MTGIMEPESWDSICNSFEEGWARGESPRIEDLLDSESSDQFFTELLAIEIERRLQLGHSVTLDEYIDRFADRKWLVEEVFRNHDCADVPYIPDTFASPTVSHLPTGDDTRERSALKTGDQFGPYQILSVLGKGGMGIVYAAHHGELDRRVALKVIRAEHGLDAEQITRFKIEAQAAARLDHPGIVPVFDVGEIDNVPFISMAYVDGPTLSDVVRDEPMGSMGAAGITRTLAEAVQFAHERDIIHRDLKPQNVLIDGDNPRLTDFGLARIQQSDADLTTRGQVLGTPNYMPPEQAAGDNNSVGPTADVYSLGAILYRLVVGRPPFQASSAIETLRQVLDRDPVPARQLNAAIDRDLETICMRCLAKEPAKRFESAGDLADDLGRYLNGEPIQSRPVGNIERFRMWCRRRPAVAALTIALAVVTVVGFSLVTWKWRDAVAANELANRNLGKGSSAVNRFFNIVAEARLLNEPGAHKLRRELLEAGLDFQQQFIADNGDNPQLALTLAQASEGVARMYALMGDNDKALAQFQAADAAYQRACELSPESREAEYGHCQCLLKHASQLLRIRRRDEADRVLNKSQSLAEQIAKQPGAGYRELDPLAQIDLFRAGMAQEQGDMDTAEQALDRALKARRQAFADHPDDDMAAYNLASTLFVLSTFQREQADMPAAIDSIGESIKLLTSIRETFEDRAGAEQMLQTSKEMLFALQREAGIAVVEEDSIVELTDLMSKNPDVASHRLDLLLALNSRSTALIEEGRFDQAADFAKRAAKLGEETLEKFPNERAAVDRLAHTYDKLGQVYQNTDRPTDSLSASKRSAELWRMAHAAQPGRDTRHGLCGALFNLGMSQLFESPREAEPVLSESMTLAAKLLDQFPTSKDYKLLLARTQRANAQLELMLRQDVVKSRKLIDQALPTVREFAKPTANGRDPAATSELIAALEVLLQTQIPQAPPLFQPGQPPPQPDNAAILATSNEMLPLLEGWVKSQPDNPIAHAELGRHRGFRSFVLFQMRKPNEAHNLMQKATTELQAAQKRFPENRAIRQTLTQLQSPQQGSPQQGPPTTPFGPRS